MTTVGNVLTEHSLIDDAGIMGSRPVATHTSWTAANGDVWNFTIWWRLQHGKAVPVGLEMRTWATESELRAYDFAKQDGPPAEDADVAFPVLDSKLLKTLPIGQIQTQARETLLTMVDVGFIDPEGIEPLRSVVDRLRSPERGRGLGDDHYQAVAEVYRLAVAEGVPPTKAVAEHFTVSKSAAAKKVSRARERGLLPPTTRGRVGPLRKEL